MSISAFAKSVSTSFASLPLRPASKATATVQGTVTFTAGTNQSALVGCNIIDDIRAGTPAEQAGLRKGDVILAINETAVMDLRDYARILKTLQPGETIRIRFRRDGREQNVTTQVMVR